MTENKCIFCEKLLTNDERKIIFDVGDGWSYGHKGYICEKCFNKLKKLPSELEALKNKFNEVIRYFTGKINVKIIEKILSQDICSFCGWSLDDKDREFPVDKCPNCSKLNSQNQKEGKHNSG